MRFKNGFWTTGTSANLIANGKAGVLKSRALRRYRATDTLQLCASASLSPSIPPMLLGRVLTETLQNYDCPFHRITPPSQNTGKRAGSCEKSRLHSLPSLRRPGPAWGSTFFCVLSLLFHFSRADIGSLGAELEFGKSFNNARSTTTRLRLIVA